MRKSSLYPNSFGPADWGPGDWDGTSLRQMIRYRGCHDTVIKLNISHVVDGHRYGSYDAIVIV